MALLVLMCMHGTYKPLFDVQQSFETELKFRRCYIRADLKQTLFFFVVSFVKSWRNTQPSHFYNFVILFHIPGVFS